MSRKKLLYIGNKLASKGATVTSIETLGNFLQQEGYELRFASSQKNKLLRLLDMVFTTLGNARWADHVLIDTYSTQNFLYAEAVASLCRLVGRSYIPILRGGDLPKRLKNNPKRVRKLIQGATKVVAPSAYLFEAFNQAGFQNLIHIPNTIDLGNYPYRERKPVAPKLLWVRSFHRTYNPELALQIVENLSTDFPNVELCMIGPDKDGSLDRCKAIAREKNLPVTFTGKMEKAEWIAHARDYDLFINTTNFDNTPVSVIEAMALGLPVISTDVGGMPYLIDNQRDGILVPKEDAVSFVQAISRVLKEPQLAQQLAKAARRKVEGFDWENVKQHWFEILDSKNN